MVSTSNVTLFAMCVFFALFASVESFSWGKVLGRAAIVDADEFEQDVAKELSEADLPLGPMQMVPEARKIDIAPTSSNIAPISSDIVLTSSDVAHTSVKVAPTNPAIALASGEEFSLKDNESLQEVVIARVESAMANLQHAYDVLKAGMQLSKEIATTETSITNEVRTEARTPAKPGVEMRPVQIEVSDTAEATLPPPLKNKPNVERALVPEMTPVPVGEVISVKGEEGPAGGASIAALAVLAGVVFVAAIGLMAAGYVQSSSASAQSTPLYPPRGPAFV